MNDIPTPIASRAWLGARPHPINTDFVWTTRACAGLTTALRSRAETVGAADRIDRARACPRSWTQSGFPNVHQHAPTNARALCDLGPSAALDFINQHPVLCPDATLR